MSFLSKIFADVIVRLCRQIFNYVIDLFKTAAEYKEVERDEKKQSEKVQSIADQIKALRALGEPVPKELEDKLIEESRKLTVVVDDSTSRG